MNGWTGRTIYFWTDFTSSLRHLFSQALVWVTSALSLPAGSIVVSAAQVFSVTMHLAASSQELPAAPLFYCVYEPPAAIPLGASHHHGLLRAAVCLLSQTVANPKSTTTCAAPAVRTFFKLCCTSRLVWCNFCRPYLPKVLFLKCKSSFRYSLVYILQPLSAKSDLNVIVF